jgi:putative FmdB family regulatory protein
MPFYDYSCVSCGEFRALRPMAESRSRQACPVCEAPCDRQLSAPFLAGGSQNSQTRPSAHSDQTRVRWRHACGFGCSHS